MKQKADIIESFVQSYIQSQDGKRAEPAYSQAARKAAPEHQEEQTMKAAEQDLEAEGISKAIILKHQDLIKEWLETVILAPTEKGFENTDADDGSTACGDKHDSAARRQMFNRSNSVSTHRSQSSNWAPIEADEILDYAPSMIAKVLRSKYPASIDELFALPIKRAFSHLDLTKRGWLPLAEVEEQCSLASSKLNWIQHATILPIFLQAKIPKHFQNYGDDDSENFRRPKLAKNFGTMTDSDKEIEMELYRRRQVHYFYLGYTSSLNKAHLHAMGKYNLVLRNQLYDTASRPWEGDNTSLQAELIKTIK